MQNWIVESQIRPEYIYILNSNIFIYNTNIWYWVDKIILIILREIISRTI